MKQYYINKNSDKLLLFFAGWGCDEYEFEHLESDCDILIFYDYQDLSYDFDFSKYKEINMLTFSAGVFIGSIFKHDFVINKKVALDGNPYLFDERFGLSRRILEVLKGVNEDNCEEFAKNYLVMTEDEYNNFNGGKRTIASCRDELESLAKIYNENYSEIKDVYDVAIMGEFDPIFNLEFQREFYGEKLKVVKNARHNIFFRIKSYNEIFEL